MSDFLLSTLLLDWYRIHRRELPWRETQDPYKIWISEIILQQTRVQQGLEYYNRFILRFPDIKALAAAPLEEVLKYWQGLGYYSRARNLHAAAIQVATLFDGVFPKTYEDILALKGIGTYTAAAIASFAYDLPYAVIDGNVYRVLSRVFALPTPIDTGRGKKDFQQLADSLIDPRHPALHNQAMMELGALQCIPVNPDCSLCPLHSICVAAATRTVADYPVKQGKTKVRDRWFHYFYIEQDGFTFIRQRTAKDIWSHLYEFPLVETEARTDTAQLVLSDDFLKLFGNMQLTMEIIMERKHILSHQHIHAVFYRIVPLQPVSLPQGYLRIPLAELDNYPVSRLTHLCIEQL
ncbi:MAG: A/G-specific adenine glycosylase [Bacteroidales bacterium]